MDNNGDDVVQFNSNQYEVIRTDVKSKRYVDSEYSTWKYFVCALFINMILSCPVYVYGLFLIQESSTKDVLPPILFNSVYLMLTPRFFNSNSIIHRLNDRSILMIGIIITSVGITINGLSSSETHYLIGTIVYGGLGGIGTCMTMAKVWHTLNQVHRLDDLHWINAIFSTGQSMCQFIFPYTLNSFINAYGHRSAIMLMGAMLTNALPLCLIISQKRHRLSQKLMKRNFNDVPDRYNDMPGFFKNIDIDIENSVEIRCSDESLQKQFWQNPGKQIECIDGKIINSFGVEIMDIIEEENEEEIDNHSINSILIQKCEIITIPKTNRFEKIKRWLLFQSHRLTDIFYLHVIHHLHRAFSSTNFIPLILLKSTDIYTYVLCVTVLPYIAITRYGLDSNEIPFMMSSLAFPWLVVAVSTPFQGKSFSKNLQQIFVLSGLLKIVGLFFILISTSKILLTLSSTLIGFTQGISFFLQDEVIRSAFSQTEWKYLRSSVYCFTGLLLLIFGIISKLTLSSFLSCLSVSLVLYVFSFVCWILVPKIRSYWSSFNIIIE